MQRTKSRTRRPARLRTLKLWAVVSFDGRILTGNDLNDETLGEALAIYPRRYLAAVIAGKDPDRRVVPVAVRSLQHRPR